VVLCYSRSTRCRGKLKPRQSDSRKDRAKLRSITDEFQSRNIDGTECLGTESQNRQKNEVRSSQLSPCSKFEVVIIICYHSMEPAVDDYDVTCDGEYDRDHETTIEFHPHLLRLEYILA